MCRQRCGFKSVQLRFCERDIQSPSEQTEKRIPQRYGAFEGFVSVDPRDSQEVDYAAEKQGRVLGELEIMYPDRLG